MKAPSLGVCQDAARSVGQRRIMRHLGQPKDTSEFAPLGNRDHHAPVVGSQELLQDQQDKELRLCVGRGDDFGLDGFWFGGGHGSRLISRVGHGEC